MALGCGVEVPDDRRTVSRQRDAVDFALVYLRWIADECSRRARLGKSSTDTRRIACAVTLK